MALLSTIELYIYKKYIYEVYPKLFQNQIYCFTYNKMGLFFLQNINPFPNEF